MNKILVMFRCKSTSFSYNNNQSATYAAKISPFTMGDKFSHRHKMLCQVQFHCQSVIVYFISFNERKTGFHSRAK
jgi:hypothetical protein